MLGWRQESASGLWEDRYLGLQTAKAQGRMGPGSGRIHSAEETSQAERSAGESVGLLSLSSS